MTLKTSPLKDTVVFPKYFRMLNLTKSKMKGFAATLGGFVIHLTLGNVYSFGNVMTYAVSYMHLRVSSGITKSNFVWVNTCTVGGQGLFMIFGGLLAKRVGPRLTCLLGSTLFSAGIMLTYFTIDVSLVTVVLTYGVISGCGIAIAYASPLACGMKWFPRRKGLINGVIVGGFGLGALLSTTIETYFLNPDNISPDSDGYFRDNSILDKVPTMYVLLGVVFIAMDYVGCLLLSTPQVEEEKNLLQSSSEENNEVELPSATCAIAEMGPKEIVRNKMFYVFWSMFMLIGIAISYISAMYKTFGQTFIKNDHFLAMVGSLAALFNASGRILWGRIMDKTSFKISVRVMGTLLAVLLGTLPLTSSMGKAGYAAWIWLIYLTFSGTYAIMPTVIEKAYGVKQYSANFGLLFTSQAVSGTLMASLNQILLETIGFSGCFVIVGVVVLLAVGLSFLLPDGL